MAVVKICQNQRLSFHPQGEVENHAKHRIQMSRPLFSDPVTWIDMRQMMETDTICPGFTMAFFGAKQLMFSFLVMVGYTFHGQYCLKGTGARKYRKQS